MVAKKPRGTWGSELVLLGFDAQYTPDVFWSWIWSQHLSLLWEQPFAQSRSDRKVVNLTSSPVNQQ